MSYILDALRKSDQQRQRGATPTLLAVPATMAEARQPAVLAYGVLTVALVGAGVLIGWLRPGQVERASPAAGVVAVQPFDSSPHQSAAMTPPALPETMAEPKQASPALKTMPMATPRAAPRLMPEKPAAAVPTGPASDQGVMTMEELPLAIRREFPKLAISLHAYSPAPQDRLVSINGQLMREGDSPASGVRLEQITPDGMIFSYKGLRFHHGVQ